MLLFAFRSLIGAVAAFSSLSPVLAQGVSWEFAPPKSPSELQRIPDLSRIQPYRNPLPPPRLSTVSTITGSPNLVRGFKPGWSVQARRSTSSQSIDSRAFGSFGLPYTTSRVELGGQGAATNTITQGHPSYLSSTFPYSAIGRLLFDTPEGKFACTAALIRSNVIVTAAHCLKQFGKREWFKNFEFVPGFYAFGSIMQSVPFGVWKSSVAVVPSVWTNGTDPGKGAARLNDIGVIILNKRNGQFLSSVIGGQLGYSWNSAFFNSSPLTGNIAMAETSTFGYPKLIDFGRVMQITNGPSTLVQFEGLSFYAQGTSQTTGSSGGPWIVNFGFRDGVYDGGANPGAKSTRNVVIAVTSFGPFDPNREKGGFASRFGQNSQFPQVSNGPYGAGNIGALLNFACKLKPTGSTLSYEQLNFCS